MTTPQIVGPMADPEVRDQLNRIYTRLQSIAARGTSYDDRALATDMLRLIEILRGDETRTDPPPPAHHA